jgi:hypothetical protein
MTAYIKFRVDQTWICVEGGARYAPVRLDYVTFAVRESRPNGQPGRRAEVNWSVERNQVLGLALQPLELDDRMTPETTWSNGQIRGRERQS